MTTFKQGYERDGAPNAHQPHAVRWWFYRTQGGFTFARGGRVGTCRQARAEIRAARDMFNAEAQAYRWRPTHVLTSTGDLVDIVR